MLVRITPSCTALTTTPIAARARRNACKIFPTICHNQARPSRQPRHSRFPAPSTLPGVRSPSTDLSQLQAPTRPAQVILPVSVGERPESPGGPHLQLRSVLVPGTLLCSPPRPAQPTQPRHLLALHAGTRARSTPGRSGQSKNGCATDTNRQGVGKPPHHRGNDRARTA